MIDVVEEILAFNAGRDPERLAMKYARLRSGPEGFLRGTAHLYNVQLPREGFLYEAPLAWACGDLHLENFGSYKADNRLVHFDINDFDDALRAPATLDLLRLMTSALVSAEALGIARDDASALCRSAIEIYAAALSSRKSLWVERETAKGVVGDLLNALGKRSRAAFLDSRTDLRNKQRSLRLDGEKALPISKSERKRLDAFMEAFAEKQADPRFFRLVDAARRISGNGSLGVARYILLVRGAGGSEGNYLLDLKAAQPSSMASTLVLAQPEWVSEAERVVKVQACMQANMIAMLHAVDFDGRASVLRELQPAQDRVELAQCHRRPKRLRGLIETEAAVLGWAQLRASGHYGAACGDALALFGEATHWRRPLLALAEQCAARVQDSWACYASAYDKGVFRIESGKSPKP